MDVKVIPSVVCEMCGKPALSGHRLCPTHLAILSEANHRNDPAYAGILPHRKTPWADGKGAVSND